MAARRKVFVNRYVTWSSARRAAVLLLVLASMFSATTLAGPPAGSAWLDGGDSRVGLILLHGRGRHPTWLVVDPLRKGVHAQLGFHTLSLQMPVADSIGEYADLFPEACARIEAGVRFLREERGVETLYLLGHSMGARMASTCIAEHPDHPFAGLVVVSCRNNGGYPFSCAESLDMVDVPVLDIWGDDNARDAEAARERRSLRSPTYVQVAIADANHKFEGHEEELVAAVVAWLAQQAPQGQ